MADDAEDVTLVLKTWDMRGEVLERVIPMAETQGDGGIELTLHALDLYDDGFIVRHAFVLPEKAADSPVPVLGFDVHDDLGTTNEYHHCRGSFGGNGRVFQGEERFTPVIDRAATSLAFRVRIHQSQGTHEPTVTVGSFEFVVSLA